MSRAGETGVTVSDLEPEEATKVRLSEWLTNHDLKVAWEKQNGHGYDVFHVDDAPRKPDLLIQRPYGYTIAAETKRDDSKSDTYTALLETNDYWLQYRTGQTEYTLDGETVDIDGFVVANGHSLRGRLFEKKYEKRLEGDDFGEGRQGAIDRGELPPMEYSMTEQFTRIQWRVAKKVDGEFGTGIGALLSTALEWDIPPKPAVLWTQGTRQDWFEL